MINPLLPFAIKGVIWYQGESNASRAYQYRTLFPTMIENCASSGTTPTCRSCSSSWRRITTTPRSRATAPGPSSRSATLTSEKLKNTAEAVITDVGDENNIHPTARSRSAPASPWPRWPWPTARRSLQGSDLRRGEIRRRQGGPEFKSIGKGLEAKDGPLTGFTVAGEDKKFHEAKAEIKGDTVVVAPTRSPSRSRCATAGPTRRSSTCLTRTACPRRRSARTTSRSPPGRRASDALTSPKRQRGISLNLSLALRAGPSPPTIPVAPPLP